VIEWDDTTARSTMSSTTPINRAHEETCATCERPVPHGTLRCDTCVNDEYDRLRATYGEKWRDAHKQWRRGKAGRAES